MKTPKPFKKERLYSRSEVTKMLCKLCRLGDTPGSTQDGAHWRDYHYVNGVEIPCASEKWNKVSSPFLSKP